MPASVQIEFRERPSVTAYMVRALYPAGLRKGGAFPSIDVRWPNRQPDRRHLGDFLRLTGLPHQQALPIIYPQVVAFRLQMVILTHPSFPLPIWRVLQVRNHLRQHHALAEDAPLDFDTRVAAQRVLEKGTEVDVHTTAHSQGEVVWESLNTFYYRGRFGRADPSSPLTRAPEPVDTVVAQWQTPLGGGWRFGGLSGDYNGIHYWSRYARLFGFRGAFLHPQVVVSQCLAHLPAPSETQAQRLDVWLKGPVYYGSQVSLRARSEQQKVTFALFAQGDERPAVLGRWCSAAAESRLLGEGDQPRLD
jgi:hypothetical protein